MAGHEPFVLLDDARPSGARDAQAFEHPRAIFVARRPEEVESALRAADHARRASGATLAGYIAYEAGLALEPRLAPLAEARCGADGPLVWLGLFDHAETIPTAQVPQWLAARAAPGEVSIGPLEPQISLGAYDRAFTRLQDAIRAGDIYQANLTFPLAGPWRGDPLALYAAIRPAAAAGYGGVVHDGSHWLLSFSPELFFTLHEGAARVKPMKGTRPRGRDAAEDRAMREALAASAKDRAENLMIVDLMRNDLARTCAPGSVKVPALAALESYANVHHLVSRVTGRLAPGRTAWDAFVAAFPSGSVTGAPKLQAMAVIADHEPPRGPYCGSLAWIGVDGALEASVLIRTLAMTETQAGWAFEARAGGGVVADSDPADEAAETTAKIGAILKALTDSGPPHIP